MRPLVLLLALLLEGCSLARRASVDLLLRGSAQREQEKSWDFFRESFPSDLSLLEGLWSIDPTDERTMALLAQGHATYAFVVWETLALGGDEQARRRAMEHYSRALAFGEAFLRSRPLEELDSNGLNLRGAFFWGQALLGLANLRRDDPALLVMAPRAKEAIDWVCQKAPAFYHGACPLALGAYEAGRPFGQGGDEILLRAMERFPDNLMLPVAYVQFVAMARRDKALYLPMAQRLRAAKQKFEASKIWAPQGPAHSPSPNLMNATAMKRWEIIQKIQHEIF